MLGYAEATNFKNLKSFESNNTWSNSELESLALYTAII